MKLEKYLADYIKQVYGYNYIKLEETIKQGLDAFESAEEVGVMIIPHDPNIPAFYWSKQ